MRGERQVLAGCVVLLALLVPAVTAGTPTPLPVAWHQTYLEGMQHLKRGDNATAAERLRHCIRLQPEARKGVHIPGLGTYDYDPYFNLATSLVRLGATGQAVERLIDRSRRAGVTQEERLQRLEEAMRSKPPRQGRRPGQEPAPAAQRNPRRPPPHTTTPVPPTPSPTRTPEPTPTATATAAATPIPTPTAAVLAPIPAPTVGPITARRLGLGLAALLALVLAGLIGIRLARRRPLAAAADATPTEELVTPPRGLDGKVLGPYQIEERLGGGGMATTYRAVRRSDGKQVALKIPHEQLLEDGTFRERFLREGHLGSQLHHPNIVRILEAGEAAGRPFIAMEIARGKTLRDLIAAAGELPLERALDVTRQVAEALDYAHSKGVIHRDLKPENLMVTSAGEVLVMDFGIARVEGAPGLTSTNMFLGTPAYAAPEAISAAPTDHRVDLYALGILLFEMLEGASPFADLTPMEQLRAHAEGRLPKRASLGRAVPDPVWQLLDRLTARHPDDRPPTAEALLIELKRITAGTQPL